jgi:acyl transferase domain-containing protein
MRIPQNFLAKKIKEQLFFWTGENTKNILEQLCVLENTLRNENNISLYDLARTLYLENSTGQKQDKRVTLAIVAESTEELKTKIASFKILLKESPKFIPARHSSGGRDSKGIYFSSEPLAKDGKIAFLFSGQGSQRPNMLKDLKNIFPEMSGSIKKADMVLKNHLPKLLSEYIFSLLTSTSEEEKYQMEALTQTNIAQPALGAVEVGLLKIMKLFGVNADVVAGHSLGEYVALYAAGVLGEKMLYELLEYRGSAIINSSKDGNVGSLPASQQAGMLAVGAGAEDIKDIIKNIEGVYIANLNSPKQTILSGGEDGLDLASAKLKEKRLMSKKINVSCAFHSPYMAPAKDLLFQKLSTLDYKSPVVPVYSNLTASQYPQDKESILAILSEHLVSPVRFTEEIENMFKNGARVFVEIGPGNVLVNLVKQILGEKDYIAIASNIKTATDISQLLNVFAQLMAEGFEVDLSTLYSNS